MAAIFGPGEVIIPVFQIRRVGEEAAHLRTPPIFRVCGHERDKLGIGHREFIERERRDRDLRGVFGRALKRHVNARRDGNHRGGSGRLHGSGPRQRRQRDQCTAAADKAGTERVHGRRGGRTQWF